MKRDHPILGNGTAEEDLGEKNEEDPCYMLVHLTFALKDKYGTVAEQDQMRVTQEIMSHLMFETRRHLATVLTKKREQPAFYIYTGGDGPYRPEKRITPARSFVQDKILCIETLFEMCDLHDYDRCTCAASQELVYGGTTTVKTCQMLESFREARFAEHPTLRAIVNLQIWLDIHDTLQGDLRKVRPDMEGHLARMSESLARFESTAFTLSSKGKLEWKDGYSQIQKEDFARLQKELNLWLHADPLDTFRRGNAKHLPDECASARRSTILDRHPVLCGLIAFDMYTMHNNFGRMLVDKRHTVRAAAGLYSCLALHSQAPYAQSNAAQAGSLGLPEWRDMSSVLDMFYLGDMLRYDNAKTDLTQQYRFFSLDMGYDVTMINTRIRHSHGLVSSSARPSLLCDPDAKICRCNLTRLMDRWPTDKGVVSMLVNPALAAQLQGDRRYFTTEDLQAMLRELGQRQNAYISAALPLIYSGDEAPVTAASAALSSSVSQSSSSSRRSRTRTSVHAGINLRRAKKHQSNKFSLTQLVSLLEMALTTDTDSLYFDFISFYLACDETMAQASRAMVLPRHANDPRAEAILLGALEWDSCTQDVFQMAMVLETYHKQRKEHGAQVHDARCVHPGCADASMERRVGRQMDRLSDMLCQLGRTIAEKGKDEVAKMRGAQRGFF
jgi:hypothetical protein